MLYEISAGIIIYRKTKEGPKFLLLYHGGRYWNFPKGKLDKGEKSLKAALREVKEETGLCGDDLRFNQRFRVYDHYIFFQKKQKVFKVVIYYLAETFQKNIKISNEHFGYGWFLYKEARRMLIYQNLKKNLKNAYNIICRKRVSRHKNYS